MAHDLPWQWLLLRALLVWRVRGADLGERKRSAAAFVFRANTVSDERVSPPTLRYGAVMALCPYDLMCASTDGAGLSKTWQDSASSCYRLICGWRRGTARMLCRQCTYHTAQC